MQKYYTHAVLVGLPSAANGGQLWRVCGAGGTGQYKKRDAEAADPNVVRVFVTWSPKVRDEIAAGRVKYNF